jgi:hypothetical protein
MLLGRSPIWNPGAVNVLWVCAGCAIATGSVLVIGYPHGRIDRRLDLAVAHHGRDAA